MSAPRLERIGNWAADNPELSVIVVSWNCSRLLSECLRSVQEHAGPVRIEVIVVDNASADDTLLMLGQDFPQARVIANPENMGFAKASNQGMAVAKAPLFCLLNPDTLLVHPNTLAAIKGRLDTHPEIGAAGCRLVFPGGGHQVGDAGYLPTLGAVLAHAFLLSRLAPGLIHGLFLQEGGVSPPYGTVGWVCGACTVLRSEVLEQVGGLDESYFLYGEDLEWGCRMNAAGVRVAYLPDISIVHHQGGTQKGKGLPSTRWIDGVARLYFDYNNGRHWRLFRVALAVGFLLRAILYAGTARSTEMLAYSRHASNLRPPHVPVQASRYP